MIATTLNDGTPAVRDDAGKLHKLIGKDSLWKLCRRESGLARFERENTRTTKERGRTRRAYLVPGTREAGEAAQLELSTRRMYDSLMQKFGW